MPLSQAEKDALLAKTVELSALVNGLTVDNQPPPPPPPPPPISWEETIRTHHDVIPRFVAVDAPHTIRSGAWSDAAVWSAGKVPDGQARVSGGHEVFYGLHSDVRLDAVEVLGRLIFVADASTRMRVNELQVLSGGALLIGSETSPVDPDVTAEIVFNSQPDAAGNHYKTGTVDMPGQDPQQWGCGLLVIGGRCEMHGAPMSHTFVRLSVVPRAGESQLRLTEPVTGWKAGDRLVIPDTRQVNPIDVPRYWTYEPQWEVATIAAISGQMITLTEPLKWDHNGAVNADGSPAFYAHGEPLLPHVANLTRNVVLRSENPEGVRGHTAFIGRAHKDIRYTLFQDLGRTRAEPLDNTQFDDDGNVSHIGTNQIARYPDHNHHLWGPANGMTSPDGQRRQSIQIGNAVVGSGKWGITIHGSHYGLFRDNVCYDIDGSAVAGEDGSEFGNEVSHNFVCRVNGGSVRPNGQGTEIHDLGDRGDGFWFAGPFNRVEDNVACNVIRTGYVVFPDNIPQQSNRQNVYVPRFPGADMMSDAGRELRNVREFPSEFSRNEVYGATTAAIHIWDTGDSNNFPGVAPNRINDMRVWHVTGSGSFFYYAAAFVIDGWLQRGDPAMLHNDIRRGSDINPSSGAAITWGGAGCRMLHVANADIQGVKLGIFNRGRGVASEFVLSDSYLDNWVNIRIQKWSQNPADGSRDMLVQDVATGSRNLKDSLSQVVMFGAVPDKDRTTVPETNRFRRFNGQSFDLYYDPQQLPDHVLEDGAIEGRTGLTNQEAWDQFGLAFAGHIVPPAPTPVEARAAAEQLGIKNGLIY